MATSQSLGAKGTKDMTQGGIYSQIIYFALPIMLSQVFQQLYNTADSLIVGHYLGTDALAAVSSSGTLIFLLVSFFNGTAMGARFGILSAVILAELVGVVIYLLAPQLIAMFDSDPTVIALGVQQARTASLFYFLLAFSHAVAAVCRGAGKAFVPMFVMLSIWCAVRIAYIAIVTHFWGDIGLIYWAYPITWAISSVIYLIYYNCSDWIHGFDKEKNKT